MVLGVRKETVSGSSSLYRLMQTAMIIRIDVIFSLQLRKPRLTEAKVT
jgi:hypothetical protein